MRALTWVVSGLAFVALGSSASEARGDDCAPRPRSGDLRFSTCIDVDNLWLRPGSGPFLSIGSALTTPPGQVAFGLAGSYSSRPLRFEAQGPDPEGRDVYVVDNLFNATFLFALGVTDRLELTAAAPVTLYQDGDGYEALLGGEEDFPRSVMRDARFGLALAILPRPRRADADGLSLVGRFEFTAPFGEGDAFGGARAGTAIPALTADFRYDRLTVAAEVGARIRPEEELGQATWGTQVNTSLGGYVDIWEPLGLAAGAEAFALVTAAGQGEDQPLLVPGEWIVSARMAPGLGGDLGGFVAGGGPIPFTDAGATAPRFRFSFGVSYAPRGLDTDSDGVLDRDDACVSVAEDKDAFEDADGCPDPDNDGDRIPDTSDRCRDEAETMDGFDDADGCPDVDDDRDGVPDESDKCRNEAEDQDGFRDDDGCPDPDNDGDGILDERDTCPAGAEDKDGFRDEDGCPDPDNDADGIPDTADKCPNEREDKDGFEDADGCPDPDNDADGVLDARDKCPDAAETLDGQADEDGCPEAGSKSLVSIGRDGHVGFSAAPRFAPGSSAVPPEMARALSVLAKLLATRERALLVVEAFPDKAGDKSARAERLASARADAVRSALLKAGLPSDRVNAVAGDLESPRKHPEDQIEMSVTTPPPP